MIPPKTLLKPSKSTVARYTLCGQTLKLLPERAIFWPEKRYLLLADAHLGKAGHFRKHGAPIPRAIHDQDLAVLSHLVRRWEPDAMVILGDLFHSTLNNEWLDFERWLGQHASLPVVLVRGNHDILPEVVYEHPNLTVYERWTVGPFLFTHEPVVEPVLQRGGLQFAPPQCLDSEPYNLAGHVHPGVQVPLGMGQRIKLPCFLFTASVGLLPAFGQFTGCATVRTNDNDRAFAVLEGKRVIPLVS